MPPERVPRQDRKRDDPKMNMERLGRVCMEGGRRGRRGTRESGVLPARYEGRQREQAGPLSLPPPTIPLDKREKGPQTNGRTIIGT